MPGSKDSKFFRRLLLFCFSSMGLLLVSYLINVRSLRSTAKLLSEDVRIVATGSSLMTAGFDPSFMEGSTNVALAAEPFFVSYLKIKSLVTHHPHIDKVLFSYSLPELNRRKDSFLNGKSALTSELLNRLSYMTDGFNLLQLKPLEVNLFSYLEVFIRNRVFPNYLLFCASFNGLGDGSGQLPYLGEYLPHSDVGPLDELIDINRQIYKWFPVEDGKPDLSVIDNAYADSIVHFCSQKNIQLFLIGFPIRRCILSKVPADYLIYYNQKLSDYEQVPNVHVLNMTSIDLSYVYYNDPMHLNQKGAKLISKKIVESIDSLATVGL